MASGQSPLKAEARNCDVRLRSIPRIATIAPMSDTPSEDFDPKVCRSPRKAEILLFALFIMTPFLVTASWLLIEALPDPPRATVRQSREATRKRQEAHARSVQFRASVERGFRQGKIFAKNFRAWTEQETLKELPVSAESSSLEEINEYRRAVYARLREEAMAAERRRTVESTCYAVGLWDEAKHFFFPVRRGVTTICGNGVEAYENSSRLSLGLLRACMPPGNDGAATP